MMKAFPTPSGHMFQSLFIVNFCRPKTQPTKLNIVWLSEPFPICQLLFIAKGPVVSHALHLAVMLFVFSPSSWSCLNFTGQVFCKTSLNVDLFGISLWLWLHSGFASLAGTCQLSPRCLSHDACLQLLSLQWCSPWSRMKVLSSPWSSFPLPFVMSKHFIGRGIRV